MSIPGSSSPGFSMPCGLCVLCGEIVFLCIHLR